MTKETKKNGYKQINIDLPLKVGNEEDIISGVMVNDTINKTSTIYNNIHTAISNLKALLPIYIKMNDVISESNTILSEFLLMYKTANKHVLYTYIKDNIKWLEANNTSAETALKIMETVKSDLYKYVSVLKEDANISFITDLKPNFITNTEYLLNTPQYIWDLKGYNEKININADDISMQVLIDRFVQTFRNNYNGNINVTEFFHLIREILCTISTEKYTNSQNMYIKRSIIINNMNNDNTSQLLNDYSVPVDTEYHTDMHMFNISKLLQCDNDTGQGIYMLYKYLEENIQDSDDIDTIRVIRKFITRAVGVIKDLTCYIESVRTIDMESSSKLYTTLLELLMERPDSIDSIKYLNILDNIATNTYNVINSVISSFEYVTQCMTVTRTTARLLADSLGINTGVDLNETTKDKD